MFICGYVTAAPLLLLLPLHLRPYLHSGDMLFNSSSTYNFSLDSPNFTCITSDEYTLINTSFSITRGILLFPLSILVLHMGHQQWRRQHSFTTTSHSQMFTYHVAAMELIWVLGVILYFWGYSIDSPIMMMTSFGLSSITYCGETLIHVLTCVERYLAVVHPIIYLKLRNERGVRLRNISLGSVWLLDFVSFGFTCFYCPSLPRILFFFPLIFSLVIISFCSFSVLRVLIRPGPGDGARNRERAGQSKERASLTIMTIMGVLWLWFGALIVSVILDHSSLLSLKVSCVVRLSAFWFNLPSSLVLLLLYLHREEKLACCCCNDG